MPDQETIVEPQGEPVENEKLLIEKFIHQKTFVDDLKLQLSEATKLRDDLEDKIIKNLVDDGKVATAKYDGLGHLTIIEEAAHASIEKGRQDDVKEYLRKNGREDLIKETISAAALSVFVRECLKQNIELPPGVTFFRGQHLNFYPAK